MTARRSISLAICVSLALALQAGSAAADDAATPPGPAAGALPGLEEIVVTAQKRGENVQSVPIAITAITPSALDQSGITDTADLQAAVPGLVFSNFLGDGQPYLRGVGNESLTLGTDSSVSVYVDGVYMARMGGAVQEFYDVERVEVVKGPQGTLFGRNSVGGSINIVNRRPQVEFGADLDVTIGNNALGKGRAAVNVPLSDNVFLRASVITSKQDGFFRNLNTAGNIDALPSGFGGDDLLKDRYGGINVTAGRLALRWLVTDATEVNLAVDASDDRTIHGTAVHSLSQYPSPAVDYCRGAPFPCPTDPGAVPGRRTDDPYQNYLNALPSEQTKQSGIVGTVISDLGQSRLTSITAYRHYSHQDFFDLDATDYYDSLQHDYTDSDTFTQEFQLASTSTSPLEWVAGVYFLYDKARQNDRVALASGAQVVDFQSHLKTTAWAAFAQGSYSITDAVRLTLGARYSTEEKDVSVDHKALLFNSLLIPLTLAHNAQTWSKLTPKIGIDWHASDQVMLYASAQEGFKSGGYNTISTDPNTYEFQPEEIKAYEVGVKSTVLDNRLRVNLALFDYDYKDLQTSQYDATAVVITNAAKAKIKGADLDLSLVPVEALELRFAAEYLDAKYDSFQTYDPDNVEGGLQDLSGYTLPRAPKFSYTVSANYSHAIPGENLLDWFLEYSRTDQVYYSPFNQPYIEQGAFGLLGARLTAHKRDGRLSVSLWGKNLTDEAWYQHVIRNTSFVGAIGSAATPRTFGITIAAHW